MASAYYEFYWAPPVYQRLRKRLAADHGPWPSIGMALTGLLDPRDAAGPGAAEWPLRTAAGRKENISTGHAPHFYIICINRL
ncbi:hypothetical protein A0H81_02384 [Grifola frondosa]|uniref:Uncharacterized protein n=1 Tax=Grifola frondosa TaxID=5627 RepID=A0A1C7MLT0_GRIFR|nr:hypothetical protein A0H81_02384 [Grifola frondosa]